MNSRLYGRYSATQQVQTKATKTPVNEGAAIITKWLASQQFFLLPPLSKAKLRYERHSYFPELYLITAGRGGREGENLTLLYLATTAK